MLVKRNSDLIRQKSGGLKHPQPHSLRGPCFTVQLVSLSWATGSVSSGNLSAFDVIGSKAGEIGGDDTIGSEESCPWQVETFVTKS